MNKIYKVQLRQSRRGVECQSVSCHPIPAGELASVWRGRRYLHEAEAHGQAAGVGRVGGAGQQRARAAQRRVRRRAPRRLQRLQPARGFLIYLITQIKTKVLKKYFSLTRLPDFIAVIMPVEHFPFRLKFCHERPRGLSSRRAL